MLPWILKGKCISALNQHINSSPGTLKDLPRQVSSESTVVRKKREKRLDRVIKRNILCP